MWEAGLWSADTQAGSQMRRVPWTWVQSEGVRWLLEAPSDAMSPRLPSAPLGAFAPPRCELWAGGARAKDKPAEEPTASPPVPRLAIARSQPFLSQIGR